MILKAKIGRLISPYTSAYHKEPEVTGYRVKVHSIDTGDVIDLDFFVSDKREALEIMRRINAGNKEE